MFMTGELQRKWLSCIENDKRWKKCWRTSLHHDSNFLKSDTVDHNSSLMPTFKASVRDLGNVIIADFLSLGTANLRRVACSTL